MWLEEKCADSAAREQVRYSHCQEGRSRSEECDVFFGYEFSQTPSLFHDIDASHRL